MLRIRVGPLTFGARMEEEAAPKTCAAFAGPLPFRQKLIQARWSGESAGVCLRGRPLTPERVLAALTAPDDTGNGPRARRKRVDDQDAVVPLPGVQVLRIQDAAAE